jgi:hypothetical protein
VSRFVALSHRRRSTCAAAVNDTLRAMLDRARATPPKLVIDSPWRSRCAATVAAVVLAGCLGPSKPAGDRQPGGGAGQPGTVDPVVLDLTDPIPPELSEDSGSGPYSWNNVVIRGGGFVTGIVFSTAAPNVIYARTDVGGAYRWNMTAERWIPITDWIGRADSNWMGIESIAADPSDAATVYLAAGTYLTAGNGVMLRSNDFGKTFERFPIGAPMGGNVDGRSMGERLAVDPNAREVLYFGSRNHSLWRSTDSAATWRPLSSFPTYGDMNLGLSFVLFDRASGEPPAPTPTFYVGVATKSGPALYRTRDAGTSFEAVPGQPAGMMPHHAVMDANGALYLAYNDGPGPNDITAGAIWRYDPASGAWSDVSPDLRGRRGGFGAIAVDASNPAVLMASTIDVWAPDEILRSTDAGAS